MDEKNEKLTQEQSMHLLDGIPMKDKILYLFNEHLLESFEKNMKNPKYEIEQLIFDLIDNDVLQLGFGALEFNNNPEHYFEKSFLENLEKRIKEPKVTIKQVIKEIEEYLNSQNTATLSESDN